MIPFEKNGWTVSRRIGVGDRELVRAGLLQIGLMSSAQIEDQLSACIEAAKRLGTGMRVYVNTTRINSDQLQKIIFRTMGQARDYDFMDETDLSPERFSWVLGRCDLIVEGQGSMISTA